MPVRIHPMACGWLTSDAGVMISGQSGEFRMPVASYLLEHPDGLVVFDTGLHPDLVHSPARMHGLDSMFSADLDVGDTVGPTLEARGFDPASIDVIVSSHLHFDHCGGHGEIPNARVLVQKREWEAGHNPRLIEFGVYDPSDFDVGHDVTLLDGEHDVFGDGALRIVPTPGHTPGHQSLVVDGKHVLVGDACYCRLALDLDTLPQHSVDPDQQRAVFAWLRAQEAEGAQLLFSHDAVQWESLASVI